MKKPQTARAMRRRSALTAQTEDTCPACAAPVHYGIPGSSWVIYRCGVERDDRTTT